MNNGDLKGYINAHQNMNNPIPEKELWELFYQSLAGLTYIHKNNLINRDIKTANLFMTDDKAIKIGDFGIAALNPSQYESHKYKYSDGTYINEDLLCHGTFVGTEGNLAKELKKGQYDQKIDVYSMGCVFYELLYFDSPLMNLDNHEIKEQTSEKILEIIDMMRQDDKDKRYSSTEAYAFIEKEFFKISKNSSIFSLITCLSSFKDLNNSLDINKPFANSYKEFLGFLSKRKKKK